MAQLLHVDRLTKLTLTRKGKAVAKHPLLRSGVVETVKAHAPEEGEKTEETQEEVNWYKDFEDYLEGASFIPDDCWEASFAARQQSEAVEKAATKKKNYPNSQGPFAGPHNSFPIRNQSDVYDAARLVGHAQNPAAVKAAIIRIAHSKGYSLPKSWQTKATKSMERLSLKELAEHLAELAKDEEVETPDEESQVVEKARPGRKSMHSHDHAHQSRIGYGYSHDHDHGHDSDGMANHEKSETAHAHEHVSKAEDVTNEEILANQEGLHKDVLTLKALVEDLTKKFEESGPKQEEAMKAIDAKREEAEKVIAEKAEALKAMTVAEARKPLTLGAGNGTPQRITKEMKFDDALHLALHGSAE